MSVIKSVLVPVNFSGLAADAYQFSLHLGAELSATVHLLYCVTPPPGVTTHADMFESILEDLRNSAGQTLAAFREEGIERAKLARLPVVTTSVSVGRLSECIGRTIEQEDVDLVLIGTHGVQNVWDRLFGTNAAFLAKQLEIPLLILPPGTRYRPFRSVCFATDFRDRDLKLATRLNKALFPFLPNVHFLHVLHPEASEPAEGIGFFRRAFERPGSGVAATFTTVTDRDITDGVFGYLGTHEHDLLVMVKPDLGWWKRLVFHSETSETAKKTPIPLLILGEDAWQGETQYF